MNWRNPRNQLLNLKSVIFAVSLCTISAGTVMIAVGAFHLHHLDDHISEHAADFYDLARQFGSMVAAGARICFAGCLCLTLILDHKECLRAGLRSAVIGLTTTIFGLFLFPIHYASGAVYSVLLSLMFGSSLMFLSVALFRYLWHGKSSHRQGVFR